MPKLYMMPTVGEAANDTTNAINQIVLKLEKFLTPYGYEITGDARWADIVVGHAGQGSQDTVDVAHCHGLYPTAQQGAPAWHYAANRSVIANLRAAQEITVPSRWVAEILQRDMHFTPDVVGWAIEPEHWPEGEPKGYVLWNKTRMDAVCTPVDMQALASLVPEIPFVSTFGKATENVTVTGRQKYEAMRDMVQGASVYLATTKETFGIGTLEAMASGVPVLGYAWGGTADLVRHGVSGYLAEPGDVEGLKRGLEYCLAYRQTLGYNGRLAALQYTWPNVARQMAAIYDRILQPHQGPLVSVIIPCYNYGKYIREAINSVALQKTAYAVEIIVVDDGSTDGSAEEARLYLGPEARLRRLIVQPNAGVAMARNKGISEARGKYIVCLDADDRLGHERFLQTLSDALERDRTVGIAYTGLTTMSEDGQTLTPSAWPGVFSFEKMIEGRNQIPTCCMFRRDAWVRAGGYRRRFTPAEDAEFWLRILSIGFSAQQVTEQGWFLYRYHDKSLSSSVREGARAEPDWRYLQPWTRDRVFPFATGGKNNMPSHAVRNYDRPAVSVIIPVGPGHLGFLREALDTVEGQTIRQWECVVVLDTPEQPTENLLRGYPWVRWLRTDQPGTGAGAARNIGAFAARGPLVTFLDADDMLEPTFLENALAAYSELPGRGYVYTDWYSLNKAGEIEVHEADEYEPGAVFTKPIPHGINIVMSRDDFVDLKGFDEAMVSWEDVEFFMRLAVAGVCGKRVPGPHFTYRYTTGARRERGEAIKPALMDLLRNRFSEYISGAKVCCNDTVKAKPKIGATTMAKSAGNEPTVKITYNGPDGGHSVVGPVTGTKYGRHQKGDVFFVYAEDAKANDELFVKTAEAPEHKSSHKQETPPPPKPQVPPVPKGGAEEAAKNAAVVANADPKNPAPNGDAPPLQPETVTRLNNARLPEGDSKQASQANKGPNTGAKDQSARKGK